MRNEQLRWWHVRWRPAGRAIIRLAAASWKPIAILSLIAALGLGAVYFMRPWLVSNAMSRINPQLSTIPTTLPKAGRAALSDTTLDCYGCRLLLPNREVVRTYRSELTTLVLFRSGSGLEISNTSRDFGIFGIVNRDERAKRLLGPELLRSKFMLMQAALSATPSQVKWWMLRSSRNERVDYLLTLKFLAMAFASLHFVQSSVPVYRISDGHLRGFQLGNPDAAPFETQVDLFDETGQYFAFDVTGLEGHGRVLTQEEVNAIVASIRPMSAH